jgi:hypothetical protein
MRIPAALMLCGSLVAGAALAQTAAVPAAPAAPAAPMAPGAAPPNPSAPSTSIPSSQSNAPSTSDPTERHPPNAASPDNVQGSGPQRQNCKSGQDTTNLSCNPGTGTNPK